MSSDRVPVQAAGIQDDVGSERKRAARSLRRAVMIARISGVSLVVLAGISLIFALSNPLSAGFAISAAVVVNGLLEWRISRDLEGCEPRAPAWLAWNQLFLGVEIAAYAAWQAFHMEPELIEAVLKRPSLRPYLEMLGPDMVELLVSVLPGTLRFAYAVVGVVAILGCAATALYYRRRSESLSILRTAPPPA